MDCDETSKAEAERLAMYKCIVSSIIDSESVYLDCLNTLIQVSYLFLFTLNGLYSLY